MVVPRLQDVALQPQDQPIAEDEPQTDLPVQLQLVPTASGTPYAVYTASPYGARSSFADDGAGGQAAAAGGADGDDAGGIGGGGSMATGFRSNGSGLLQGAGASVVLSPGLGGMGSLLMSPSGGGAGAGGVPLVSPVSGAPDRRRSVGGAGLGMRGSNTLLPALLGGGGECDVEADGGLGGGNGGGGGLRRLDSDADGALAGEEVGLGAGALPLDPMAVGVPGMGSLSLSLGSGGAVMSPFATDGMGGEGGAGGAAGGGAAGGAGGGKGRGARRHREKAPKKAPLLAGSNWLKIDYKGVDSVIRVDRHKLMHKLGVQVGDGTDGGREGREAQGAMRLLTFSMPQALWVNCLPGQSTEYALPEAGVHSCLVAPVRQLPSVAAHCPMTLPPRPATCVCWTSPPPRRPPSWTVTRPSSSTCGP